MRDYERVKSWVWEEMENSSNRIETHLAVHILGLVNFGL